MVLVMYIALQRKRRKKRREREQRRLVKWREKSEWKVMVYVEALFVTFTY